MSSSPDMNVSMNGGLAESLLQVNQLSYRLPPQISIASKCTHVINYPQQSSYNQGQTMIFDCQTGSQFVDPAASYLRFVVKPADSLHGFGSGSAANIFSRIVVRTASGKELSRVEDARLIIKMLEVYNYSNDWKNTVGVAQGYSQVSGVVTTYCDAVPSTGKVFVLPIQCLMPCMNPHGAKLVPPNLMSGLRIEMALSSPNDAFCSVSQSAALTLASYTVEQAELHLKVHELADAFQRKIQEMSQSGLNYLYKEHFHNIVSPGANSNINFDVKKACSKALTARILVRPSVIAAGRDTLASAVYNFTAIQSHIGSDYFPNQKLQVDGTPTLNNINESYYYSLYAQDKLEQWSPTSVSPAQFLGVTNYLDYNNGVICFNYNKSNVSDLAGYTTSNSRALLVDLQQASAVDVRLDVYLTYLRLCKIYLSNTIVLD